MRTVESLFCARYSCSSSDFSVRAFRICCYWRARLIAPLLSLFSPDFFQPDFEFIRQLGMASNMQDVKAASSAFEDANRWPRTFLRTRLKLRVSGQKGIRLATGLLSSNSQALGQKDTRQRPIQ